MHLKITAYDHHGKPRPPNVADLAAMHKQLTRAAATGLRLHIRPITPCREHQRDSRETEEPGR